MEVRVRLLVDSVLCSSNGVGQIVLEESNRMKSVFASRSGT